jgi:protein pelota
MKAEYAELKRQFGEIRLFPESLDDIWHLKHLVRPGDLVYATTFRSLESATDKLRPEKVEKKPVRLGVRVDRVALDKNANRVRISGVIEYGADTGFHHTLNIEPGHEISVIKTWKEYELERIERAVKSSVAGAVHILAIEEGEAELFRVRQYGPEHVTTFTGGSGKREGAGGRSLFFKDVMTGLLQLKGPLIIAGPGFVKDEFAAYLRANAPETADLSLIVETRGTGRRAVQEALGGGTLERITQDMQLAREVQLMEELLRRIGTDATAAYGIDEVRHGIRFGAAEKILIADEMLHQPEVPELLEEAEKMGASIVVFSTEFDPGIQLEALGGIAAILRFAIK